MKDIEETQRQPVLCVRDLTTAFRVGGVWKTVVDRINFEIGEKETLAVVGESGSGKSTLALAMMGYVKQGLYTTEGECLFYHSNLLKMSNRDLEKIRGRKIAMIPQNAGQALTPNLKIGYQIDEALQLHSDLKEEEREQKISELFNRDNSKNFNQNQIIKLTLENTNDYKEVLSILIPVSKSRKVEIYKEIENDIFAKREMVTNLKKIVILSN